MERVQYSLERTLPSLHTLDATKTFTRDELRALTAQRASLETALVRRIANRDGSDYIAYVAFEDKIEKLRLVRTAKAEAEAHAERKTRGRGKGKAAVADEDAPVGGTKEQQARLRAAYLARCIAIFERGVTKLKDSLPLWQAYLAWARARNMRIVVGRVFARALNLHTTHIALWIQAAGYELGTNYAANTARLLLQRAISLNTLAFTEVAVPAGASVTASVDGDDTESTRPKKKRKQGKGASQPVATSTTQTTQHRPIAFTINLTPRERDLLRLWVEYARMELVFLERLRRRWAILGLGRGGSSTATPGALRSSGAAQGISQRFTDAAAVGQKTAGPITTAKLVSLPGDHAEGIDDEAKEDLALTDGQDGEDEEADVLRTAEVPSAELSLSSGPTAVRTPAQAAQEAIMSGGLLAPLISTAFTSVAPKLRLPLALGLVNLLRCFPLLDIDAEADNGAGGPSVEDEELGSSAIRAKLAGQVLDAFAKSTHAVPSPSESALSPSNGAARALLLAASPILLHAPAPFARSSKRTRVKEQETHARLRAQGRLCHVEDEEVDGVLARAREEYKRAARAAADAGLSGITGSGGSASEVVDAPTQLIALQLVETLHPLAAAPPAQRASLPILLGQFIGNLLQAASVAATTDGKAEQPSSTSAISAAYYGLSLTASGEEARFGRLAAQLVRTLLSARLPVKKARNGKVAAEEEDGEEENGEEEEMENEEGEGPLLIQEENLRALLETSAQRLSTSKK
ncbi:U3 snoRNP protein [Tilletia horrida]|nr:U3 snoRNP protein [Tilletia horrida]